MKKTVQRQSPAGLFFSNSAFVLTALFCLFPAFVIDQTKKNAFTASPAPLLLILLVLGGSAVFVRMRLTRQNRSLLPSDRTAVWIALLLAVGFCLRLWYVLYTPIDARQHDVWSFGQTEPIRVFSTYRHAEYIEYICRYLRFPEADPQAVGLSQLYHPPFHHLLAGLWLRLQLVLGFGYGRAVESIQFLTFCYSALTMLLCGRLFMQLKLSGGGLLLAMTCICLHPSFILLAGSVNNDMLSVMLGLWALNCTVKWADHPTARHIVPVAVTVGLTMMTKLSGGLLAPGIAVVFLWRAVQDIRTDRTAVWRYAGQFALFALLCVPTALWWQIKNMILYQTPLNFVPALGSSSDQYIGNYSLWQRLFGISKLSLTHVYELWAYRGAPYSEYCIPLAFLKTAVFDEAAFFHAGGLSGVGLIFSYLLFYSHALLAVGSIAAIAEAVIRRRWLKNAPVTVMLTVCFAALCGSALLFCFRYPHTCTMNFRYLVPVCVIGAAFLGSLFQRLNNKDGKLSRLLRRCIGCTVLVFALSSAVVYTLAGLV